MSVCVKAVQTWFSIMVFAYFQALLSYTDIYAFNLDIYQDGEFCIGGEKTHALSKHQDQNETRASLLGVLG